MQSKSKGCVALLPSAELTRGLISGRTDWRTCGPQIVPWERWEQVEGKEDGTESKKGKEGTHFLPCAELTHGPETVSGRTS